ncbi:Uroporphyrinogen decarboxylase [Gossypium arboreum]|uniref:Uroporphyrinogen decarboxylase n=1 Tax=Gossypium arboreum TaxID=29729 RepID=A0A0B0PNR3_GOSAR|nr:Uroporphyrinogen decarboxylase [Gossypium arboreum]
MRANVRPCLEHGIDNVMRASVRPCLGHGVDHIMRASVRPCLGHGIGSYLKLMIYESSYDVLMCRQASIGDQGTSEASITLSPEALV